MEADKSMVEDDTDVVIKTEVLDADDKFFVSK